jgi:hypothetical protein
MEQLNCPVCGTPRVSNKTSRLAIYLKSERIAAFTPSERLTQLAKSANKSVYGYIKDIAKNTVDGYLMLEIFDNEENLISIQRVGESTLVTAANGELVKRELVEGSVLRGTKKQ